jgi:hypothetical protein
MNDDSLDELRFFDKPVEEFIDKKDGGFKKGEDPLKLIESDEKRKTVAASQIHLLNHKNQTSIQSHNISRNRRKENKKKQMYLGKHLKILAMEVLRILLQQRKKMFLGALPIPISTFLILFKYPK